ncbi:MAG: Asp-tRNA(Asn)/Glu-tRNA(Gln) amidotransferase subunit GatC [Candidatus Acidiferrales bacterium]
MKITREDVLRVAELAHLELNAAEVETYRGQLDSILEYVGKLNQLDTANVEPMAGGRPAGVGDDDPSGRDASGLRDDLPWSLSRGAAPIDPAEAMRAAPDAATEPAGAFFRVPKVIER